MEWDYGDYEGISSDLIRKDNPDYLIWTHGVPNGESLDDVAARADKIVARVLESGLDNVLIVAHGHFSRILTARWLELEPREGRHFVLGTAKVCTLGWDKKTPAVVRWGLESGLVRRGVRRAGSPASPVSSRSCRRQRRRSSANGPDWSSRAAATCC